MYLITPIWRHISVIHGLDCFFCFHIYCKNFPCGWVSPCTSSGKHIPGYYGTKLHSDSWKRALVTEFIKLYSRKTGVSEPRHWRNSLALPRTMWRETYIRNSQTWGCFFTDNRVKLWYPSLKKIFFLISLILLVSYYRKPRSGSLGGSGTQQQETWRLSLQWVNQTAD